MRLGYGLITCQRPPDDPRSDALLYQQAVELAVEAERAGLDSVWTSEHHFVDDGYMASTLITSAAIAQATSTIRIGTGILLAPLHDPLRVAEDAATVDLLSGGRFILGIGAGWRDEEFEGFGVQLSDRARRMREFVATLRASWLPGDGSAPNVTPKPAHPIPIWMGAFADTAIARAGRIADGFLGSSSGTSGIDAFARAKAIALEAAGGRDFSFALHVPVYLGAWDDVKGHYSYLRWKYADMAGARGKVEAGRPPPLVAEQEAQLRSTIICGSADDVVSQIAAYRDALGDDTLFICRNYFPGMDFAEQVEQIRRIGSDVAPRLGD